MKLSIIIPVYNERNMILKVLDLVKKVNLGNISKEIIIIDDFSRDGTREILRNLNDDSVKILFNKRNLGKGYSINRGFKDSTGDLIIVQDSDFEYDPNEYPKLLTPILTNKTKVVYGSRFLGNNNLTFNRFYLGNKFLSFLTSLLHFKKISDMETCYKVFERKVIEGMKLKSNRFGIEPEITSKILNRGYKILEVPIAYSPRTKQQGKKIKVRDGIMAILCLLRYRFVRD